MNVSSRINWYDIAPLTSGNSAIFLKREICLDCLTIHLVDRIFCKTGSQSRIISGCFDVSMY
jgi:hypothetical protein